MRNFILTLMAFIALAIPASAFALGVPPSTKDIEVKAEALIPQTELAAVRADLETVNQARRDGKSSAADVKATDTYYKAADKALTAAIKARNSLNEAEFDRQAKIVKDNRNSACDILSGCERRE